MTAMPPRTACGLDAALDEDAGDLVAVGALVGAAADAVVGAGAWVGATLDADDDGATDADDETEATLLDDELAGGGALVGSTVGEAHPTTISTRMTNNKNSLNERDIHSSSSIFLQRHCRCKFCIVTIQVTAVGAKR